VRFVGFSDAVRSDPYDALADSSSRDRNRLGWTAVLATFTECVVG